MTMISQIDSAWVTRIQKFALTGAAALMLAACGDSKPATSTGGSSSGGGDVVAQFEREGDHAIGSLDAKAVIVEHASVVCPACANWHNTVYPELKSKYIDTGKVRFIFREFPTSPENLAEAGFLLANCADEDKFFENIGLQFKRQKQIFEAARNGTVLNEYISLAKTAGLSEEEFKACMVNEEEKAKYKAVVKAGIEDGVSKTPTFFINGEMQDRVFTIEDFAEKLAPILGEPLPEKSEDKPEE